MPNQYTAMPMPARFWASVNKDGPTPDHAPHLGPCWVWTGLTVRGGYGQLRFEGRQRPAHVVAWLITHGPLSDGAFVCHRCDVRACVRPAHLFVGDQESNMADMVAKGRSARGDRNVARFDPSRMPRGVRHWAIATPENVGRGIVHHHAKLTDSIVRSVRSRYAAGGVTLEMLAHTVGVSKTTMSKIIRRKAWAHVE